MGSSLTVGALFYGNYLELAQRCLNSWTAGGEWGPDWQSEARLGLNAVGEDTLSFVYRWARGSADRGVPVHLYVMPRNALKYPVLRRMFHDPELPPPDRFMWFDDDAYLDPRPGWWTTVRRLARESAMLGKRYWLPVQGRQWDWVRAQSWFNPAVGPPPPCPFKNSQKPHFSFLQGSWWVVEGDLFRRYNWPSPELRHCGGDSLLGELQRHQGISTREFTEGVHFNADAAGRDSKAPRRGEDEPVLGYHYRPYSPPDLSHHKFQVLLRHIQ